MVTEEDIELIKEEIRKGHRKNPKAMFNAFCLVLVDVVVDEYKGFINGLYGLDEKDKLVILKGMFKKKSRFWDTPDPEEAYNVANKILEEYSNQLKLKKRKK
jgi:hypothetical protein